MLSIGEPKRNLCKLIYDAVSKCSISIEDIQPGLDKLIRGFSIVDIEEFVPKNHQHEIKENTSKNSSSEVDSQKELDDQVSRSILTIHVFDEARKKKTDFTCPRDILLNEMKYFKTFFDNCSAQSEDVDIAVHCDLEIFNWLMKYVKRPMNDEEDVSTFLEPSNWTSVLISANFLQMDRLVKDCIIFCKRRINEIIKCSSSFQCIDDGLITRISDGFSARELDEISDPKDKIKSKLFAKKVDSMLESTSSAMAVTLFRCMACKAVLNNVASNHIACISSRTSVGKDGFSLHANHISDKNFKTSEFVVDLKKNKTWSEVYWILWSCMHHLRCSRCSLYFMCHDISSCTYHTEMPKYKDHNPCLLIYSCCNLKINTFDPLGAITKQGCKKRDHIIRTPESKSDEDVNLDNNLRNDLNETLIYKEMIDHKDVILSFSQGSKYQSITRTGFELFSVEENLSGQTKKSTSASSSGDRVQSMNKPVMIGGHDNDDNDDDDDDDGSLGSNGNSSDEEQFPKAKDKKVKSGKEVGMSRIIDKESKWDVNKSLRYNQDAQRQEDQKRMKELSRYLFSLRFNLEDVKKYTHRSFAGGMFSKLETEWKQNTLLRSNHALSYKSKITRSGHSK